MLELPIPDLQRSHNQNYEEATLALIDKVIAGLKDKRHHFICMGLSVEANTDDEKIAATLLERYINTATNFEASYARWVNNHHDSMLDKLQGFDGYRELVQAGRIRWLESMKTPKGSE